MNDDPDSSSPAAPGLTFAIEIAAPAWRARVRDVERLVEGAVRAALDRALPGGSAAGAVEVGVLLADDATVRRLNRDYRGQDKATNVLAFAAEEEPADAGRGPRLLGDVVLALETLAREGADQDKDLADHTRHLVVHGVLHLLGHDHGSAATAARMERLEADILSVLGVADPYAGTGERRV